MRRYILILIDIISNFKWDLIFYFKYIFQREFRKLIGQNKRFKNLHLNERCFIVGNGPSLNKLDLSKLHDEKVFTVNEIMTKRSIYESLNSDYHVMIDPSYNDLIPEFSEDLAIINSIKKINYENKKPVCIVSYESKDAFISYGIKEMLDLNYLYQHRNITGSDSYKICMNRNLPSSQNVIQAAIFSAIYMGFKKIFLIGCDMTAVFIRYEADENGEYPIVKNYHTYNYSELQMAKMMKAGTRLDNEYMMYDYARTFTIFKWIRKYSEKNGIEIINATRGGGLDVFDRANYDSLFH